MSLSGHWGALFRSMRTGKKRFLSSPLPTIKPLPSPDPDLREASQRRGDRAAPRYVVAMNDWSDEETFDPIKADGRNFYKVEKWTADGTRVDSLLYAGNNLSRAQHASSNTLRHRPRIRLTIRQWARVLQQ
jgi:hypothetical protein